MKKFNANLGKIIKTNRAAVFTISGRYSCFIFRVFITVIFYPPFMYFVIDLIKLEKCKFSDFQKWLPVTFEFDYRVTGYFFL